MAPLTAQQAVPGHLLRAFVQQHPDAEIAIEPPRRADWLGWDVDSQSAYKTPETVAALMALAESWGMAIAPVSSSLHPDGTTRGLRLYAFTGLQLSRHERAVLAAWLAYKAGLTVKDGQLELIPALRDWSAAGPGTAKRFSPPCQTDQSVLLSPETLQPELLGPEDTLQVLDAIALQADPDRVRQALQAAMAWHKSTRRRVAAAQRPLQALPGPLGVRGVSLAAGDTNDGLLRLTRRFVRKFAVEPGRERELAPALREFLQSHPDYDKASTDTRQDLEIHNRCERLLKWATRASSSGSTPVQRVESPASPRRRQAAAFRRLLWGIGQARKLGTSWGSCRQLAAWLVRNCGVSNGWLWRDVIRPCWQWLAGGEDGDRQESREYRQALARFGTATPPAPPLEQPRSEQPGVPDGRAPHLVLNSRGAPCTKNAQTPDPDWVSAFWALVNDAREQHRQKCRGEYRAARARERAQQRVDRGDRHAPVVLLDGTATPAAMAAAAAEDADFWAMFNRAPAGQQLAAAMDDYQPGRFDGNGLWQHLKQQQAHHGTRRRSMFTGVDVAGIEQQLRQERAAAPAPAPPTPEPVQSGPLARFRQALRTVFWNGSNWIDKATGQGRSPDDVAALVGCSPGELQPLLVQLLGTAA